MQTPRRADPTPTEPPAPSPFFRYRFANVDFDESVGTLSVGGVIVVIEPRPRELLSELLRRPNEVVAREELMEALWQGRPTVDNVLANAVTKLRKALGAEGAERLINVPRVGYRLAGPIERVAVGQHVGDLPLFSAGERVPGRETYRLEAPLGRSAATALVWRARDPKLQETRIFKFAADGERLTALKREYTLYRVLRAELGERDDFARVLGANFATAPYFIECEDGGPDLLTWADEDDRLGTLSTAERLDLFLKIARAVAAAHGVGVLHKDLKPANVLVASVGDGWQAKLTDFGSSRLLDPGRLAALGVTALGLTVTHGIGSDSPGGTPLYLAPELIAGRSPTTQSDLYALGLMLNQMVAGDLRRPMSTGWQREIDDALLAADIAAATEGRPEDRLGSVAELVERLETLEARRTAAKEAADAARRAEALLADAARRRARRPWVVGGLIALTIGLATSLWFYGQASVALQSARLESARVRAINEFVNKDVLATAEIGFNVGGKAVTMVDVLRHASASAGERFKGQPDIEASIRLQLGESNSRLRSYLAAQTEFQRALDLLKPLRAANDAELLAVEFGLSGVLARLEHTDEAKHLLDVAIAAAGPATLAGSSETAYLAAQAQYANLLHTGKFKEALVPALWLQKLADAKAKDDLSERLDARLKVADLYLKLDDQVRGAAALAEVTAAPFNAPGVGAVLRARTLVLQARADSLRNDDSAAEAKLLSALRDLRASVGELDYQYGAVSHELAERYETRADFAQGIAALQATRKAFTASLGPAHQNVHLVAANLAILEVDEGRTEAGLQGLEEQRTWFAEHGGAAGATLVGAIDFQRAKALSTLGRFEQAMAALEVLDATDLARAYWGAEIWPLLLQAERGRALLGLGRFEEAAALLSLETAVDPTRQAPEAGLEGPFGRRFAGRCSPATWPSGRSLATAPQHA